MRLLLSAMLFVLALLGAGAAHAACSPNQNANGIVTNPFIDNCSLPAQGLNQSFAATVQVGTNAQLLALARSGTFLPTYVLREGFTTPGDGGAALYNYSSTACSLGAGAGDNGSQVQASGGGCWLISAPGNRVDERVWGVVADNATNNSTTLQLALNWANANSGTLLLAPGTTFVNTGMAITLGTGASMTIQGAGADQSSIRGAAGVDLLTFSKTSGDANSSFHLRDFSCLSTGIHTQSCVKLVAVGNIPLPGYLSASDIQNVTFRGSDGYGLTNCWANDVTLNYWSNILFLNDTFMGCATPAGVGINLTGGSSNNTVGAIYNISSSNFGLLDKGVLMGPFVQGVTINGGSNFTGVNYGVLIPAGGTSDAELNITDTQFSANTAAVQDLTGVFGVNLHNNLFLVMTGANGVILNSYGGATLNNNIFNAASVVGSGTGLFLGNVIVNLGATVDGNLFTNLGTGISISSGSGNLTIGRDNQMLLDTNTIMTNQGNPLAANISIYWAPFSIYAITTSAANGSAVKVTLPAPFLATSTMSGQYWFCALSNLTGFFPIQTTDTTHITLQGSTFVAPGSGACYAGGP